MTDPERPAGDPEYLAELWSIIDNLGYEIQELKNWKTKYREAAELWDALKIRNNQQVEKGMLIAKLIDFGKGGPPVISVAVTDGVDWVDEYGLVGGWQAIASSIPTKEEEDD